MWTTITRWKTSGSHWGVPFGKLWVIKRAFIAMGDEALILTAVDIGGRSSVNFDVEIPAQKVGDFDTELVKEFVLALAREMGLTVHIRMLAGENTHHIIEGIFKSLGRSLRQACAIEEEYADEIPSTKGVL